MMSDELSSASRISSSVALPCPGVRLEKGNGYEVTDGVKILAAALATSVVTVSITEPIRAWFQRRCIRRWLYPEVMQNC